MNHIKLFFENGSDRRFNTEYTLSCRDSNDYALIFNKEVSKRFEKEVFNNFWDKITSVNFMKVMKENEDFTSPTGTYIQITLISGSNENSFKLYEPELKLYKQEQLSESEYLLTILNEISVFAESKNIESFYEL